MPRPDVVRAPTVNYDISTLDCLHIASIYGSKSVSRKDLVQKIEYSACKITLLIPLTCLVGFIKGNNFSN